MDEQDKLIVTLTVAELRELLHGTAEVLVAGMTEAVAEAARVMVTSGAGRAEEERPSERPEREPGPTSDLIRAKEVAQLLGASVRQVWRLSSCGVLPPPISIGRSRRWRRTDIGSRRQKRQRRNGSGWQGSGTGHAEDHRHRRDQESVRGGCCCVRDRALSVRGAAEGQATISHTCSTGAASSVLSPLWLGQVHALPQRIAQVALGPPAKPDIQLPPVAGRRGTR